MDTKFKSILNELCDYVPKDKEQFIESRAQQVVASFINLKSLIEENYDAETSDELVKRLFSALKNSDERRFTRKIREIAEGKNEKHK